MTPKLTLLFKVSASFCPQRTERKALKKRKKKENREKKAVIKSPDKRMTVLCRS